jgi:hypothetical protein
MNATIDTVKDMMVNVAKEYPPFHNTKITDLAQSMIRSQLEQLREDLTRLELAAMRQKQI